MNISCYLVVVGSALALPQSAAAAPPERYPLRVEVDAGALAEVEGFSAADAERARDKLQGGVERLLEQQGLWGGDTQEVATMHVRVSWVDFERSDYAVAIDVATPDEQSHPLPTTTCALCSDDDLVRHIEQKFQSIEELVDRPVAAEAESVPDVTPHTEVQTHGTTQDGEPRRPLTTLGKVGIPLVLVGTGAAIGGVVLLAKGAPSDDLPRVRTVGNDLRPPGIGLLVSGGVMLAGGAVLLILDRRKAARKQTFAPVAGPGFAGFTIKGRF